MAGGSLSPIYDNLNGVAPYHPFEADTYADWSLEAGDIVTVSRNGTSYSSPVHSTSLVWRGQPEMHISSTGKEKRDPISRVSKQKYARGGGGLSQTKELFYEFYSEDGYLHSYVMMTESALVTHFDNELSDVHSEILQTANQIRSEVHASESTLYSYVDQTATYIESVVADTANDLGSAILQTASQIRAEVHAANSTLYSYVDQTATYIESVVADTANDLGSAILQTASQIRSEIHANDSALFSYVDQTATYIESVVADTANDLGSAILQTASQIRSEIHANDSALFSYVDQTATYIESVVADTANDLGSAILQTASQIRSEIHANDSALFSYVDQTATYIESVVADTANDLGSAILQTASQIRSEIHANDSALFSYVDQTATYIESVVADTANDLGSAILQTASEIRSEIHANDSALFSYVDQTATYIESVVASTASDLGSAILQTASQIRSEVHAANSSVYSYVDQTATYIIDHITQRAGTKIYTSLEEPSATDIQEGDYWMESSMIGFWDDDQNLPWNDTSKEFDWAQLSGSKLYVRENGAWKLVTDDTTVVEQTQLIRESDRVTTLAGNFVYENETWKYNIGMLNVRADEISSSVIQVDEKANELGSNIVQTATEIRSEVHAANSQVYSSITQTATFIMTHVASVQSGLSSTILQTASEIRSEVSNSISNVRSSISEQADKIALVVEGTGANAHIKPASIVAAINAQSGQSSVLISADKVSMDGSTTINDVMKVLNSIVGIYATTNFYNGTDTSGVITVGNGRVSSPAFRVWLPGTTQQYYEINRTNMPGMIRKAEFNETTNTLKLWRFEDSDSSPSITFSKAASVTALTGSWSGGTLTVVTTPSSGHSFVNTPSLALNGNGSESFSAEMSASDSSGSTAVRSSIYGYLKLTGSGSGSTVNVCKNSDGTGVVASKSVGSVYSDGETACFNAAYLQFGEATWSKSNGTVRMDIPISLKYGSNSKDVSDYWTRVPGEIWDDGWYNSAIQCDVPRREGSTDSFSVYYPTTTTGGRDHTTYTVSADSSYAYIKTCGITVAKKSISSGGSTIDNARARFNANNGAYYIEAYDSATSGGPAVSGSSVTYKLKCNSSGAVQIVDTSNAKISNTPECNVWISQTSDTSASKYQGLLAYDTLYGITAAGEVIATWRTPAATSHSIAVSRQWSSGGSSYSTGGKLNGGGISKSGLSVNTYCYIRVTCGGGNEKEIYFAINT